MASNKRAVMSEQVQEPSSLDERHSVLSGPLSNMSWRASDAEHVCVLAGGHHCCRHHRDSKGDGSQRAAIYGESTN
jgi:hypothetical protein